jgi:hypothetical protein
MAKSIRLLKSFYRLLLPVIVLAVVAVATASIWLVHETAHPVSAAYLVTPETYGMLSARGAQVTDESWQNNDATNGSRMAASRIAGRACRHPASQVRCESFVMC